MASMQGSLPRIDLAAAGIGAGAAGPLRDDSRWATVRAAVFDALCEHGCFEAVVDGDGGHRLISPELSAAVLGPGGAAESLLSLPVSTKARNASDMPYRGYAGSVQPGGVRYERLNVVDPLSPGAVRAFADLMWPDTGNAGFCTSVHAYAEKMAVVEAAVRRMVLESVGATAEYIDEQAKATSFRLRLTEYAATAQGGDGSASVETRRRRVVGLRAHRDVGFLAVLAQNGVDGMEVERGPRGEDGGWVRPALPPGPGAFLVFAGDAFKALTNGRVFNPLHRVVMVSGDRTRYTAVLLSSPKDDAVVRAVDANERPAVYRPFVYGEYLLWASSDGEQQAAQKQKPNKLEAFAAVRVDGCME